MIYLQNTTEIQRIRIPADGAKMAGDLTLSLVNVINRGAGVSSTFDPRIYLVDASGEYVHDADGQQVVVQGPPDRTRLYYVVDVELPDGMPDGEYEYTVTVDDVRVSVGLAYVGTPAAVVKEYDNTVQYEQYKND